MIQVGVRTPSFAFLRAIGILLWMAAWMVTTAAQEMPGGFRFVHLAADAPLVDVVIDGRAVFRDVGFGDVTGYVTMEAGTHEVAVVPHRLRQSDSQAQGAEGARVPERVLEPVTAFVSIAAGEYRSAVLAGFYEPPAEDRQLGHLSLAVTPEGTPFRITGPRGYAAEFTGDQLLTGIQPGTYTIMADREGFQAATYEAEVRPRQTTTVTIALQEGEDESSPEERMAGPVGGSDTWASLQIQVFGDDFGGVPPAGEAKIRFVHGSPTSPSLALVAEFLPPDVGDDGASNDGATTGGETDGGETDEAEQGGAARELIDLGTVAYPGAGSFVAVPAGRYALRFGVQGSQRYLVHIEDIEVKGGAVYTFFLASEPEGSRGRVVATVDAAVVWGEAEP